MEYLIKTTWNIKPIYLKIMMNKCTNKINIKIINRSIVSKFLFINNKRCHS